MSKTLAVKYKKNGVNLEVLTIQGTMKPYREGKMKIENVLASDQIFANASKMEKAKASDIQKCAKIIAAKAEVTPEAAPNNNNKNNKKGKPQEKQQESDPTQSVLKLILDEGEFQLNAKELKELQEKRRGEVLNYLHKYYHDPRGEKIAPHPVDRLDTVLTEAKIKIDPHVSVEHQIRPILKLLQGKIPLRPVNPPHEMNLR